MAWVYLVLAGFLEIGWPIGLKLGWTEEGLRVLWLAFAIACILCSGMLLLMAQKEIPMGTAYAVWTGIGAVGTAILGIYLFDESREVARLVCMGLIVAGITGLKVLTSDA